MTAVVIAGAILAVAAGIWLLLLHIGNVIAGDR